VIVKKAPYRPGTPRHLVYAPVALSLPLDLFDNSSNSQFTKNRGIGTILNDV